MQNAIKHLPRTKKEDTNILSDFSACMYEYEDEATFEETFSTIRSKVHKQTWLNSIYKVKEKWAECYMRNVYTLGMRSTQLSESLNNDLKNHLKSDLDIIQFFNNLERVIKGKRDNELDAEYEARKKLPRIKMRVPILVQASKIYTPCIFEYFQNEYERSMAAYIKSSEHNEFIVAIEAPGEASTFEEECKVVGNYAEQQALCTCGQFERTGILCSHALKVLDVMNIKSLPKRYILKRWTREARVGAIEDCYGKIVVEDPRLEDRCLLKFLIHKFLGIAIRAAESKECSTLVDSVLESLRKEVDEKTPNSQLGEVASEEANGSLHTARLKKKETQKCSTRRKKNWLDKQHPTKKKVQVVPDKQNISVCYLRTIQLDYICTDYI